MRRMLNNHILIPGDEGIIKCKRDKLVDMLIEDGIMFTEDALKFYNNLKDISETEKPLFTENGKKILLFMKNSDKEFWKETKEQDK